MFNNKRHKYALDLSQPFNPESVPGSTGIEKIERFLLEDEQNFLFRIFNKEKNK